VLPRADPAFSPQFARYPCPALRGHAALRLTLNLTARSNCLSAVQHDMQKDLEMTKNDYYGQESAEPDR
jgi:hypothetical protein